MPQRPSRQETFLALSSLPKSASLSVDEGHMHGVTHEMGRSLTLAKK